MKYKAYFGTPGAALPDYVNMTLVPGDDDVSNSKRKTLYPYTGLLQARLTVFVNEVIEQ